MTLPGISRIRRRHGSGPAGEASASTLRSGADLPAEDDRQPAGPPIVVLDLSQPAPSIPATPSLQSAPPLIRVTEDADQAAVTPKEPEKLAVEAKPVEERPTLATTQEPMPSSEEIAAKLGLPECVPIVLAPVLTEAMPPAPSRRLLARSEKPLPTDGAKTNRSDISNEALEDPAAPRTPPKRSLLSAMLVIGHILLLNALNLPLMVYMAQQLNPLGVGQWGAATEIVTLASLLTTLGLRPLFVRTVAQRPDEAANELAYQLGLRSLLSVAACALAFGIVLVIGYPTIVLICVAISAGSMVLTSLAMTLADLLQGLDRMKAYSAINFASGLALIAASATALYRDPNPISIAIAYSIGPTVGLVLYLIVAARYTRIRVRFSITKFRELLRESRTIAAYQISVAVRDRLERVLLPKLSGLGSFGFYYMGIMPADRLFVVPEGFITAFFPAISRAHHKDPQSAARHVLHMMVTSVVACAPLAILVTFLADPVARLLFKHNAALCRDVIMITIWAVPLRGLQLPMGSALQASGRHATAAKSGILATIFSLVLTVALIVTMGIRGACWAWVGRSAISVLCLVPAFVKAFPGVYPKVPFGRIVIGMTLMAGLLWGSTQVRLEVSHWVSFGIGACVAVAGYFFAMLAMRVIDISDLRSMRRPEVN